MSAFYQPDSLEQALALLAREDAPAILAGGTIGTHLQMGIGAGKGGARPPRIWM